MLTFGNIICGIDPGTNGGIVFLSEEGEIVASYPMPSSMTGVLDLLRHNLPIHVFIEKVVAYSKVSQGTHRMEGSAFNTLHYGMKYGFTLGVLETLGIPYLEVVVASWQANMLGKFPKGESKKVAREVALKRFKKGLIPEGKRVPHDGIVDAALIATYGIKKMRGEA